MMHVENWKTVTYFLNPYFLAAKYSVIVGYNQYAKCPSLPYTAGTKNIFSPESIASTQRLATTSLDWPFEGVATPPACASTADARKFPSTVAGNAKLNATLGCSIARDWNRTSAAAFVEQ